MEVVIEYMRASLLMNANGCYKEAEEKAAEYFHSLYGQVKEEDYFKTITKDLQLWKSHHLPSPFSFFFNKKRKTDSRGYHYTIRWLERNGKLDDYLDRSISYLFMRDLGKDMNSVDTKERIQRVVASLKSTLTASENHESFSIENLYRMAQKEDIEEAMIWVMEKLRDVSSNIPEGMDAVHAQRKLIKIIAGVLMNAIEECNEHHPELHNRPTILAEAIRVGYYYGLTYPFIDDLLDSGVLSTLEKKQYSDWIRTTLITGEVPEMGNNWAGDAKDFIPYVYRELREAYQYIKAHQHPERLPTFFEQSYIFFHSQEVDREKDLFNGAYLNEELYIPIILKSASSRSIVRLLLNAPEDSGYEQRTFYYGIYNQLADDFADMFGDMEEGAVTPYTYYMKHHGSRPDLINPFELYWAVIYNLIHHIYHSDVKIREIILNRAINGLKRFKIKWGTEKYDEVMALFAPSNSKFNQLLQKMVRKADNVDFFDKLLRDHMIEMLKSEREQEEEFTEIIKTVRSQINEALPLRNIENDLLQEQSIIAAANYSLAGNGKRLRPIVAWFMGVHEYGLKTTELLPLLKSLEYMHTASLIFDDLPSQDNASMRRGRLSLHEAYNTATAELAGLFLTQKATQEQASLEDFDSKTVLKLIQYSTHVAEVMCRGQAMDLNSKGKSLRLEELNQLCFYKTGIAFEASLIMPAILARKTESEINELKKFAYHAGIAFQIKDDLLDVEGESAVLGKPIAQDDRNHHSTFVTILGKIGAKKAMWEHFCSASDVLKEMPGSTKFLKSFLNYIVHRNR